MASHVLPFPTTASSSAFPASRGRRTASARNAAEARKASRQGSVPEGCLPGPRLIYRRPAPAVGLSGPAAQARRASFQIQAEVAGGVQKRIAERRAMHQKALATERRAGSPSQATRVGLRERLLDALLFFARPA